MQMRLLLQHIQRLQTHRTNRAALAAAKTNRIVGCTIFVLQQAQNGVGGLDNRNAQLTLRHAHHGAAADDTLGLVMQTAGHLDQIVEGGADGHQEVLGLGDGLTGDGDDTLGQSLALGCSPADGGEGGDIEHGAANRNRQLAAERPQKVENLRFAFSWRYHQA